MTFANATVKRAIAKGENLGALCSRVRHFNELRGLRANTSRPQIRSIETVSGFYRRERESHLNNYFQRTPTRIPVRLVDGSWEFFYGGAVPVRDGTIGELIIAKESIFDPKFLRSLRKRSEYRVLDEGTELMVALSVRDGQSVPESLMKLLREIQPGELSNEYFWVPRPNCTRFAPIVVGPPGSSFARQRPAKPGGVWLQLEGMQPKGVVVSSVELPKEITSDSFDSFNHAFTKLSEVFEPWRRSHTGNIYTRVLYRESNRKWYPLERLRSAAEATEEHALIKQRWSEFISLFPESFCEDPKLR